MRVTVALFMVSCAAAIAVYIAFGLTSDSGYVEHDHQSPAPRDVGDYEFPAGYEAARAFSGCQDRLLEEVDLLLRATLGTSYVRSPRPRSRTYVTRTFFSPVPNYTTVSVQTNNGATGIITFRGTARFGWSDFGANRARIKGWLEDLDLELPTAG